MSRPLLGRLPVVLAACGLALVAVPPTADAATLEQQGWWYRLRPAGLPELPTRPDVAEGQLLVEGAPDGPLAVAAVRFQLDDGETAPVLSLRTVDEVGAPETTVVLACAADVRWNPAEGGPWGDRPFPECSTSVEGSPSADGTGWTFPVAALVEHGVLDVVLLPGRLANGSDPVSGSTFRLVLDSPSLATTIAPAVGSGAGTGTGGLSGPAAGGAPGAGTGGGSGGGFAPPATATGSGPPTSSPGAGAPPVAPGGAAPTTVPGSGPANPASSATDDRARGLGLLILALAVGAALAADRFPGLTGASTGVEAIGGLGRFARPRSAPPPSLL